jgi:gamma-glutamyltranspeptidase/glutathione hydrolase/leukotriene-C4 hydrolase
VPVYLLTLESKNKKKNTNNLGSLFPLPQILNILAQYGVPEGISGPLGFHRLVESLKHAFAVRMKLGDPDFADVAQVVSDMISPKFAEELKKTIYDNMTFDPGHYGGR